VKLTAEIWSGCYVETRLAFIDYEKEFDKVKRHVLSNIGVIY
jgi:hypothetical protein